MNEIYRIVFLGVDSPPVPVTSAQGQTAADPDEWQLLEVKRDRTGGRGTERPPPKGERLSFFRTESIAQTGTAAADINVC